MVKLELPDCRSQAVLARHPSSAAYDQPNEGIVGIMAITAGQLLNKGVKWRGSQ